MKYARDTILSFDSRGILNRDCNQCNDDAGSLRLNPNSKRRVHSIAVNPSAALSAERMSLAGIPEGIVSTNADTRDPLGFILLLVAERVFHG